MSQASKNEQQNKPAEAQKPAEAPPPAQEQPKVAAAKHPTPVRALPAKLTKYIDDKLKDNGLFHDALARKDARTIMRLAAECLVGVREEGGNNRGPLVELIQDVIGEPGEYWPWCMSFVQVCIGYAEEKTGIASPIFVSEHVMTVWNKTDKRLRCTVDPLPGAIIIWRKEDTEQGHTGILTSFGPIKMTAIEGNTESGIANGKVERDGGGVYHTERNRKGTGQMSVVGFLKPF